MEPHCACIPTTAASPASPTPRSCSRSTSASPRQTSAPWPSPTPTRPRDVAALKVNPQLPGDSSSPVLSTTLPSDTPCGGPDVPTECQCGGSYRERNRACLRTVCKEDSSTLLRIVSDSKIGSIQGFFKLTLKLFLPLARASEALQLSESRPVRGKIVL